MEDEEADLPKIRTNKISGAIKIWTQVSKINSLSSFVFWRTRQDQSRLQFSLFPTISQTDKQWLVSYLLCSRSMCWWKVASYTYTQNSTGKIKWFYWMRGREGVPWNNLLLAHNQSMVHKMFTNIFLFFTLSNHAFIPPFKPLWIKAAPSLALCQLNSITITILGPGRWMGDEGRRKAEKNGWHSHWNRENNQLNWEISHLMHLNQIQQSLALIPVLCYQDLSRFWVVSWTLSEILFLIVFHTEPHGGH